MKDVLGERLVPCLVCLRDASVVQQFRRDDVAPITGELDIQRCCSIVRGVGIAANMTLFREVALLCHVCGDEFWVASSRS
jgi:hypothetical protein